MLEGKIALVTGGARGIGKAITEKLAELGATVIINYSGSEEKAKALCEEIRNRGGNADIMKCNVSDYEECENLAKNVLEKYKRLDILVNNAGITRDGLIMRMSEKDYDDVLNTNLKGAFNMIRHFSKSFLKQRSGHIINISSVSGVMGNPGQANYSASKAGIIGLTKSVARELASRGVCVNAVAPGFIQTDMTEQMPEAAKEGMTKMIPLGRIGQPQDIAEMVAFLADEKAGYITGQVFCVDGGMAI